MELTINAYRQITPNKVGIKQYESGTTTLVFTRDSYMYDQVDLRSYTPYAVTCINGAVDITELTMDVVGEKLVVTWVVGAYTLQLAGNITYQIVFKESAESSTNVFHTYEAILQCSESIEADQQTTANIPTIMSQWLELMNSLAAQLQAGGVVYMPYGESLPVEERLEGLLYYQVLNADTYEGQFEDHNGQVLGNFSANYVVNANMNTLLTHGEYISGGTAVNTPISCTYCAVRVTDSASTNRIIQELYIPDLTDNTVRVFVRAVTGGDTFGEWRELASKNLGSANMAVITDANGDLTASSVVSVAELNYLNGVTSNIQTQLNDKAAGADLTEHVDDDTAHVTESERTAWNGKAPASHASASTTYGVGNAANYGHLKLSDATDSTSSVTAGVAATPAAVKAAYDLAAGKQAAITGAATTITDSNLTANMVMITDANGKAAASPYITVTELNALNGFVTGGGTVQAQINARLKITASSNGTTWYRKYSDGWIEQGGTVNVSDGTHTTTNTFPLGFSTTNYTLVVSQLRDQASSASSTAYKTSKSTFTIYYDEPTPHCWYACGK